MAQCEYKPPNPGADQTSEPRPPLQLGLGSLAWSAPESQTNPGALPLWCECKPNLFRTKCKIRAPFWIQQASVCCDYLSILMKCATQLCGSDFRHSLMLRTLSHAVCLCFYLRSAPPPHIRQVTFLLYYTLPVDEVHFKIKVLL